MERRLAAILAADVVGYTRLMGADEAGTLERLTTLREQVLEPLIAEHHGRVVKLMGDGILVEFASVVDALVCAVAWQNDVTAREAETDEDRRLQFRIGINIGAVRVSALPTNSRVAPPPSPEFCRGGTDYRHSDVRYAQCL